LNTVEEVEIKNEIDRMRVQIDEVENNLTGMLKRAAGIAL
jgi:hypothetical protein